VIHGRCRRFAACTNSVAFEGNGHSALTAIYGNAASAEHADTSHVWHLVWASRRAARSRRFRPSEGHHIGEQQQRPSAGRAGRSQRLLLNAPCIRVSESHRPLLPRRVLAEAGQDKRLAQGIGEEAKSFAGSASHRSFSTCVQRRHPLGGERLPISVPNRPTWTLDHRAPAPAPRAQCRPAQHVARRIQAPPDHQWSQRHRHYLAAVFRRPPDPLRIALNSASVGTVEVGCIILTTSLAGCPRIAWPASSRPHVFPR
jgi:hypothetical protein